MSRVVDGCYFSSHAGCNLWQRMEETWRNHGGAWQCVAQASRSVQCGARLAGVGVDARLRINKAQDQ
jgi:hypothetical protein